MKFLLSDIQFSSGELNFYQQHEVNIKISVKINSVFTKKIDFLITQIFFF